MANSSGKGNYFWRGGQRIELEKEEEVFTVVADSQRDLQRVRSAPGVTDVEPVQGQVFKVRVNQAQRDAAMEEIRNEDVISHHAYRPADGTNTRYYLTEEITVKFHDYVERQKIEQILAAAGVKIVKEYPGGKKTFLVAVTDDAGENPIKVANILAETAEVEYAEPNLINRFQPFYTPQDTHFERQWHLRSWEGPELVANADVSATAAWDITRGSRQVVVAVVDDGFDLNHPDFTGAGKVVNPKDYVDGDSNPFPVTSRGDYHGTPCAGVAIAEENGTGVVGAAPGCAFMPVRFPLTADDNMLWEIFDFVGKRADVISCSWGPVPVYAPLSQLLKDKFHELATSGGPRNRGCVIIFAAGNYNAPLNDPNNQGFTWRHPTAGLKTTTGPILNGNAAHPDVIAVAASTSQNLKALYSNWGAEVAVCAPSNNFHPTNSLQRVPGRGIVTTDNEAFGRGFTAGSDITDRFGGTSSATPLTAGVAALVISANPDLTALQVKQILQETADKIVDPNPDPILNNSKGTYDQTGRCDWFGFGRINAAKAVQKAVALKEDANAVISIDLAVEAKSNLKQSKDTKVFKFSLGKKLTVRLDGPDGQDFDLYLKRGAVPTPSSYDARGYTGSADEKLSLDNAEPGDYFILVRSYRGGGDFTVKVELS